MKIKFILFFDSSQVEVNVGKFQDESSQVICDLTQIESMFNLSL
jgi:hypothetical protein